MGFHDIVIRDEESADKDRIDQLILLAFDTDAEADLVLTLRPTVRPTISLVAEKEGRIIAHMLMTEIVIRTDDGKLPSLGVVVLAVHPAHRGRDLGSKLLEEGLERCSKKGAPLVFALTEPDYYVRHGFQPAAEHGFQYKWQDYDGLLTVKELIPGSLGKLEGSVDFNPDADSFF